MKKTNLCLIVSVVIYLLSGCTPARYISRSLYEPIKTLSNLRAVSPQKTFSVYLPHGWFSTMDKDCHCDELWIVKENYSGVVKISEIKEYQLPKDLILEERLLILAELNFGLNKRKFGKQFSVIRKPSLFESERGIFSDYEFVFNVKQTARVVIIQISGRVFEVFAYGSDYTTSPKISLLELFSIQQSLLENLRDETANGSIHQGELTIN